MNRKIRSAISISLGPEVAAQLEGWMDDNGFDNTSEAIRAMIRMSLAATPKDGLDMAIRLKAFNEAKRFSMDRLALAHEEIAQAFREALSSMKETT